MKVFVLGKDVGDWKQILGVYSSLEKATATFGLVQDEFESYWFDGERYLIEDFIVDDPPLEPSQ